MSLSKSRVEARSAWLLPACLGLKSRGTPFHLVEFSAGDGLDLIADCLSERRPLLTLSGEVLPHPAGYADSPYPILSRTGFVECRAPSSDPMYQALSREASGPRLHECAIAGMPARAAEFLPSRPEQGLLAYNFGLTESLNETDYAAFREGVAAWLKGWGDVGFWAELGLPRGVQNGELELRVHRWLEGEFRVRVLGRLKEGEGFLVLEGWEFLKPLSPVRPQRVTIEEPPKLLRPSA